MNSPEVIGNCAGKLVSFPDYSPQKKGNFFLNKDSSKRRRIFFFLVFPEVSLERRVERKKQTCGRAFLDGIRRKEKAFGIPQIIQWSGTFFLRSKNSSCCGTNHKHSGWSKVWKSDKREPYNQCQQIRSIPSDWKRNGKLEIFLIGIYSIFE